MVDKSYLESSDIIDFSNPSILKLALCLRDGLQSDKAIAKRCFEFVRDEIAHTADVTKQCDTACTASEVLTSKMGFCYAKSHLLAALLRANNIPTGFCYQRVRVDDAKAGEYCLHGLNAVYLQNYGWYRVDARGNKKGINARFSPPKERLAFTLKEDEDDLACIYSEPLEAVVTSLRKNKTFEEMANNLPDSTTYIRKAKISDALKLSQLVESRCDALFEKTLPWFMDEVSPHSFEKRLRNTSYKHLVYIYKEEVVGFIAIKKSIHCHHLFVSKQHEKQGIGKELFECAQQIMNLSDISVNASITSVEFYKSLGFKITSEKKEHQGLEYQPMFFKSEESVKL